MEAPSKQRLVVASQALELQHLQDLIRCRDKDSQNAELIAQKQLEESRHEAASLASRNRQLENQVSILSEHIQTLQAEKPSALRLLNRAADSSIGSDAALTELREELRACRTQVSSLLEEREILLEKLVSERTKGQGSSRCVWDAQRADAAVQTSDLGTATLPNDLDPNDTKSSIDTLRSHIDLEEALRRHHEETAAYHAANLSVLHEQLHRQVEAHMHKLQSEQDIYQRMMSSYRKGVSFPSANVADTPVKTVDSANSETYASGLRSTPFFQHQEVEMLNLRKRLQDLQIRHQQPDSTHAAAVSVTSATSSTLHGSSILQRMLANASRPTSR